MLKMRLFQISALAALALVLSAAQQTRADDPKIAFPHLQFCIMELREAKEDIRNVKDIPDKDRVKLLGSIDACIDQMKKAIKAGGAEPVYIKPPDRDPTATFQYLRHAGKKMKEAKEQLKDEKAIPDDVKETTIKEINATRDLLEKALDHLK